MESKISAALIIIVLLGVTSSTAAANAQQVITPQGLVPQNQPVQQFNQPIPLQDITTTTTAQDSTYNNYQPAAVDLNNPNTNPSLITNNNVIGFENTQAQQLQQQPIPINCASGVFVYQQNTLTGQVVPICVTSDMLANQLFNVDLNVKSSNNNNNDDDDDDDNDHDGNNHHNHKHYFKYFKYHPIHYNNGYKYDIGASTHNNDDAKPITISTTTTTAPSEDTTNTNEGSSDGIDNNEDTGGDNNERSDSESIESSDTNDSGDSGDSGSSDDGGSSDSGGSGGDDSNN